MKELLLKKFKDIELLKEAKKITIGYENKFFNFNLIFDNVEITEDRINFYNNKLTMPLLSIAIDKIKGIAADTSSSIYLKLKNSKDNILIALE